MGTWPRKTDVNWLSDVRNRLEAQSNLRERVAKASDGDALRGTDSALKKTTSFMKKLKTLNAASIPSIISELSKLNLSKFVEEMAQAIAETKLKLSEVSVVVELCVEITIRYANFPELILGELRKLIPAKKTDKVANPAKLRVDMRFLSELLLVGVLHKEGLQLLGSGLTFLTSTDKTEYINVGLFCSLFKPIGWQLAGFIPFPDGTCDEMYVEEADLSPGPLVAQHKKVFHDLIIDYLESLCKTLTSACQAFNTAQKRVKRQERTRGDACAEDKENLELRRTEFLKLKGLATDLSNTLGVPMITLKEEASDDEEDEIAAQEMNRALEDGEIQLWPDKETKVFYTNILDIRSIVPKNLYKESEDATVETLQMATDVEAVNMEGLDMMENEEQASTSAVEADTDVREREPSPTPEPTNPHDDPKCKMNDFVLLLDHLVNRESTDNAALMFVQDLNKKNNRKKLVKLLSSGSSRLDLVPFYARLVATLAPVMPDLSAQVTENLIQEFRKYIKSNENKTDVQSRRRCCLFIAELVKFGVVPRAEALSCLRQLVFEFRFPFIDMACTILESAGLFLYRNADSHPKMKTLLDVIVKKKERMKDQRSVMLIENSIYCCLPPEDGNSNRTILHEPPMKLFIKKLITSVTSDTVGSCSRCLRKLDWTNDDVTKWALTYLESPWHVPYSNIQYLACVVAGLLKMPYHQWITYHVIDSICETIRISLEVPGVFNQEAFVSVTYLGELYNYCACDSSLVFKILYQLISFPEFDSESHRDLYRIRMVCELLSCVAEFFQGGKSRKKMEYFFTFFNRYYYHKRERWLANVFSEEGEPLPFPCDVEEDYKSCTKLLCPHWSLPTSVEDAELAATELENTLREKMDIEEEPEEEVDEVRREAGTQQRSLDQIEEEEYDEDYDESPTGSNQGSKPPEEVATTNEVDDEDFLRELDRMVHDAHRAAPTQPNQATIDMTVPVAARQKMNRSISFADDPQGTKSSVADRPPSTSTGKVSLMTRGKGNKPVLKTVAIEEEKLHSAWSTERERQRKEQADIKFVTLKHTERIIAEEEEDKRVQSLMRNKNFFSRKTGHK